MVNVDDFQFAIAEEGADVLEELQQEVRKRRLIVLSQTNAHKVFFKGFCEDNFVHDLGYVPSVLCFLVDDVDNPTYFERYIPQVNDTEVDIGANDVYLIVFHEGNE